jgi:hypothetical protein
MITITTPCKITADFNGLSQTETILEVLEFNKKLRYQTDDILESILKGRSEYHNDRLLHLCHTGR